MRVSVYLNWSIISFIAGLLFLAIGLINIFWGNDPFFGALIVLLSMVYFLWSNTLANKWFGFSIHWILKVLLGLFILWAALGVGELIDKITLMLNSF